MACCAARFPEGTERLDDDKFVYYPHRVGNNVLICGKKNSRFPFQCFVGPEWPCMAVTITLIVVPTYYFCINVASNFHIFVALIAIILASLTIGFYIFTACSDPGIVFLEKIEEQGRLVISSHADGGDKDPESLNSASESVKPFDVDGGSNMYNKSNTVFDSRSSSDENNNALNPVFRSNSQAERRPLHNQENYIECSNCNCKRPRNAHHCHECKLCILDLDHHCPWTGKCIGKKNLTFFHNFLVSLSTLICFVIIAVIYTVSSGFPVVGDT